MTPELMMARMQDRAVERYNLNPVPGRPEERSRADGKIGVSFAYSGGEIRVRPMLGRGWVDDLVTDFRLDRPWESKLDELLDQHFGPPRTTSDAVIFNHPNTGSPLSPTPGMFARPRPIRDNPQA